MKYEIASRPYEPIASLQLPGFAFEFTAQRYFLYYLWQVIIPQVLIVMMSCTVFWIDPTEELIGILMTQVRPYNHLNIRADFQSLVNQAIVD